MRHRNRNAKLGRDSAHRRALVASLVCNLIREGRIRTTLPKAKVARRLAEKMVTAGRKGTLSARRRMLSILRREDCVARLVGDLVPQFQGRQGGYTRILKLGRRRSDSSEMAFLEWIGIVIPDKRKKKKPEQEKSKEKPKS